MTSEFVVQHAVHASLKGGDKLHLDEPSKNKMCTAKDQSMIHEFLGEFDSEEFTEQDSLSVVKGELNKYLDAEQSPLNYDPLTWWVGHAAVFPLLAAVAQESLCVPATTLVPKVRLAKEMANGLGLGPQKSTKWYS